MTRYLRTLGVEPIAAPESFFVKAMKAEGLLLVGEVERASSWAEMLFTAWRPLSQPCDDRERGSWG
jgi:hypothetical protein